MTDNALAVYDPNTILGDRTFIPRVKLVQGTKAPADQIGKFQDTETLDTFDTIECVPLLFKLGQVWLSNYEDGVDPETYCKSYDGLAPDDRPDFWGIKHGFTCRAFNPDSGRVEIVCPKGQFSKVLHPATGQPVKNPDGSDKTAPPPCNTVITILFMDRSENLFQMDFKRTSLRSARGFVQRNGRNLSARWITLNSSRQDNYWIINITPTRQKLTGEELALCQDMIHEYATSFLPQQREAAVTVISDPAHALPQPVSQPPTTDKQVIEQQPVQSKPVDKNGIPLVTQPQIGLIFKVGKNKGYSEDEVKVMCADTYGCKINDLARNQASEFINALKGMPENDAVPAGVELGTDDPDTF